MRKSIVYLVILVVALTSFGGLVSAQDCGSEEVLCVGLVTDVGEIDDKSFNQSAWAGVQQAEAEYGATVQFVEMLFREGNIPG